MADDIRFHEDQDLFNDYNHLTAEEQLEDVEQYGEYLQKKFEEISEEMQTYWDMNESVGRGRQGTKWRVKYRRCLARRDQVEQVYTELLERDMVEEELSV